MMKRLWRLSDAPRAEMFLHRCSPKPKTLTLPIPFSKSTRASTQTLIRELCAQTSPSSTAFPTLVSLFADKGSSYCADPRAREELRNKVSHLSDELIRSVDDTEEIVRVLEEKGVPLFRSHSDGSAFVELLKQLHSWLPLALEVFSSF